MMSSYLPRPRASVIISKQDDERFLLDVEGGAAFEINETTAKIFTLCQQQSSFEEAVAVLARELAETGQEALILEDIRDTVKQFAELGLLQNSH